VFACGPSRPSERYFNLQPTAFAKTLVPQRLKAVYLIRAVQSFGENKQKRERIVLFSL
jgi:hypothetical protein